MARKVCELRHSHSNVRDRVVTDLARLLDMALRGWMESLPVEFNESIDNYAPYNVWVAGKKREAIHVIRAEAEEILRGFYPPRAGLSDAEM